MVRRRPRKKRRKTKRRIQGGDPELSGYSVWRWSGRRLVVVLSTIEKRERRKQKQCELDGKDDDETRRREGRDEPPPPSVVSSDFPRAQRAARP